MESVYMLSKEELEKLNRVPYGIWESVWGQAYGKLEKEIREHEKELDVLYAQADLLLRIRDEFARIKKAYMDGELP